MPASHPATALAPPFDADDPGFCDLADRIIRGAAARFEPREVIVVRIDRWFSRRWLGFKCKSLGAFGVFASREGPHVVVPPFVPARVRSQQRFELTGGELRGIDPGKPLHVRQASHENKRRLLGRLLRHRTLIAWISGGSAHSGRGALMVYAWDAPEQLAFWYAGAARLPAPPEGQAPPWAWVQTANVSRAELAAWAST